MIASRHARQPDPTLLLGRPALRADEGMWTFDNLPAARIQAKYGFAPDAGLAGARRASPPCACPGAAAPSSAPTAWCSPTTTWPTAGSRRSPTPPTTTSRTASWPRTGPGSCRCRAWRCAPSWPWRTSPGPCSKAVRAGVRRGPGRPGPPGGPGPAGPGGRAAHRPRQRAGDPLPRGRDLDLQLPGAQRRAPGHGPRVRHRRLRPGLGQLHLPPARPGLRPVPGLRERRALPPVPLPALVPRRAAGRGPDLRGGPSRAAPPAWRPWPRWRPPGTSLGPLRLRGLDRARKALHAFAAGGPEQARLVSAQLLTLENAYKICQNELDGLKDPVAMARVAEAEQPAAGPGGRGPRLPGRHRAELGPGPRRRSRTAAPSPARPPCWTAGAAGRWPSPWGWRAGRPRWPGPKAQRELGYRTARDLEKIRASLAIPRPLDPGVEEAGLAQGLQEALDELGPGHPIVAALLAGRTPRAGRGPGGRHPAAGSRRPRRPWPGRPRRRPGQRRPHGGPGPQAGAAVPPQPPPEREQADAVIAEAGRAHRPGPVRSSTARPTTRRQLHPAAQLRHAWRPAPATAPWLQPFTTFGGLYDRADGWGPDAEDAFLGPAAAVAGAARRPGPQHPAGLHLQQRHHRRQFRLAGAGPPGRAGRAGLRRQHRHRGRALLLRPPGQPQPCAWTPGPSWRPWTRSTTPRGWCGRSWGEPPSAISQAPDMESENCGRQGIDHPEDPPHPRRCACACGLGLRAQGRARAAQARRPGPRDQRRGVRRRHPEPVQPARQSGRAGFLGHLVSPLPEVHAAPAERGQGRGRAERGVLGVCVWDQRGTYDAWMEQHKGQLDAFTFGYDPAGKSRRQPRQPGSTSAASPPPTSSTAMARWPRPSSATTPAMPGWNPPCASWASRSIEPRRPPAVGTSP